jgi:hypothetical protein
MSDKEILLTESKQGEIPALPEKATASQSAQTPPASPQKEEKTSSAPLIIGIIIGVVLLAAIIAGAIFLVNHEETASTIRDIFIILVALEFMLIGWVLIILIIQLAKLVNMLQNEVQPMIESTNEAVNTIRGTSIFISENLTEPIIKLNSYVAALNQFTSIFTKKGKRKE